MNHPDRPAHLTLEPLDEPNRVLLANVHPADWKNPAPQPRYNLVVIGAGTAGLVTAAGAAGLGARVALVERALLGGDCLNVGCVPSKALIRASRAAAEMNFVRSLGGGAERPPDFAEVMRRLRSLRAHLSHHDSVARFASLGVDVFIGEARFAADGVVEVASPSGSARLIYSRAVLATGARAVAPPIPGLAEAGYRTNETIFNLTELPRRLVVIGGGPIGCELAQAFARLGSQVTLVEQSAQFLPREDADGAAVLLAALRRDGVDVLLTTKVDRVLRGGPQGQEEKSVWVSIESRASALPADEILIGVGRAPNVEGLNLEAVGVAFDARAGVKVDDTLRTTNPRIYAAGDVCLPHKFTHTADAAARIVIQNALFSVGLFGKRRWSDVVIPWCTYTDPEIAHVGIGEREAASRGIALDTYKIEMSAVDRAVLEAPAGPEGATGAEGFLKIHTRHGTDEIVGATMVSSHAGESISEITLAITQRIGLGALSGVVHPYPTQAEAIRKCADAYRRTRLTPGIQEFFARWLRWRR